MRSAVIRKIKPTCSYGLQLQRNKGRAVQARFSKPKSTSHVIQQLVFRRMDPSIVDLERVKILAPAQHSSKTSPKLGYSAHAHTHTFVHDSQDIWVVW